MISYLQMTELNYKHAHVANNHAKSYFWRIILHTWLSDVMEATVVLWKWRRFPLFRWHLVNLELCSRLRRSCRYVGAAPYDREYPSSSQESFSLSSSSDSYSSL